MTHKVEIIKITDQRNIFFMNYGVFLLGVDLLIAQGFYSVEDATDWITNYNKRFTKLVLKLVSVKPFRYHQNKIK